MYTISYCTVVNCVHKHCGPGLEPSRNEHNVVLKKAQSALCSYCARKRSPSNVGYVAQLQLCFALQKLCFYGPGELVLLGHPLTWRRAFTRRSQSPPTPSGRGGRGWVSPLGGMRVCRWRQNALILVETFRIYRRTASSAAVSCILKFRIPG